MKNKLLLTSALASVVALAGSAVAETKVSGNLEFVSNNASATTALASVNGNGFEENIRIDSSKDIALGKLSYGFNIENAATEGAYIQVTSKGGLTAQIGADSFMNLSSTVVPNTGEAYQTIAGNIGALAYESSFNLGENADLARKNAVGLGISQAFGKNTVAVRYTPNTAQANANSAGGNAQSGTSTIKYMFTGDLGVSGLKVAAGYAKDEGYAATPADGKGKTIGAAYTVGKVTVGAQRKIYENIATAATQDEFKTNEFGIGFAVNDSLSVSLNYIETDGDNDGTDFASKEKITGIGIGYNLGGIALELSYADVENVAGTTGADGEAFQLRTVQKF